MTYITENTSSPELKFGNNIRDSLENIRKWAMFLAIMVGLYLLIGLIFALVTIIG